MTYKEKPYLKHPTPPPAIRTAMARASKKREKGEPVANFASGNVGQMPANLDVAEMSMKVKENIPEELGLVSEAVLKGLKNSFTKPKCLAYSTTGGTEEDKKLALEYFEKYHGIHHGDTERVMVTTGGQEAITAALRSVKTGTNIYMSKWDYAPPVPIIEDNNCKLIKIGVKEGLKPDLGELKEKAKEYSVFYISMPNNPSGFVSADTLKGIVAIMTDKNGAVIWDAPYLFTILKLDEKGAKFEEDFQNKQLSKFKETGKEFGEDVCITSSISKTCLSAGLRYGFLTANRHWVENANGIVGREDLSAPTISFYLGREILRAFLENPITHHWLNERLASRLNSLIERDLPLILPENGKFGALYALLETGEMDGAEFSNEVFERYGVVTVPAKPFFGEDTNVVRLSLVSTPWTEGDEEWMKNVEMLDRGVNELT
ncbi:hypothetical protein AKJ53_00730 [candidate division MSBL1 archaeon SCGC-AAA382F02]|uniref:Aminotransferase class I/classII large domain-containing protein n=1 Tax=candidate division MSBL1 archaeon SCGC-AAA382F02 TaxID=1698282 RepID=A0A133VIL7_9EURY|nr:hypothetical protein AKJ53_00730 [candidate division MSBL1 archaeon SCGC-AAA382F02]